MLGGEGAKTTKHNAAREKPGQEAAKMQRKNQMIVDVADQRDDEERRNDPEPYGFASDEIPFDGAAYGDAAGCDAEVMDFSEWRTHWQLVGDELVTI